MQRDGNGSEEMWQSSKPRHLKWVRRGLLDSIPKMMILHDIPYSMWSLEAINYISIVLGKMICAQLINQGGRSGKPKLKICVTTNYDFKFLPSVELKVEGMSGKNQRIQVECINDQLIYMKCRGYGHWSQRCSGK